MTANATTIDHFLRYASPAVEPVRSLAELDETQLAAVQKLMSTLQAGDVSVQGKIRVDLSIEVDVGAAAK